MLISENDLVDGTTSDSRFMPDSDVEKPEKETLTLEPCDKVATLYVMQQKFETPSYDSHE